MISGIRIVGALGASGWLLWKSWHSCSAPLITSLRSSCVDSSNCCPCRLKRYCRPPSRLLESRILSTSCVALSWSTPEDIILCRLNVDWMRADQYLLRRWRWGIIRDENQIILSNSYHFVPRYWGQLMEEIYRTLEWSEETKNDGSLRVERVSTLLWVSILLQLDMFDSINDSYHKIMLCIYRSWSWQIRFDGDGVRWWCFDKEGEGWCVRGWSHMLLLVEPCWIEPCWVEPCWVEPQQRICWAQSADLT